MNKNFMKIIVFSFIAVIVGIAIYNILCDCNSFLKVNAINCISALIVIGASFFIVQRQTDYRKQKDIFIKLLESLKGIVDDEKSYNLSNVEQEVVLMRTRDMRLKIDIIKSYSTRFEIQKAISFVEEKFEEYEMVIGNHISDMDTLCKLNNELKRPLNLISQKIFEIMLNMFN